MNVRVTGTWCLISVLAMGYLCGCAKAPGLNLAPVSGKVTLDGQPLADATVTFIPESTKDELAPASFGKTDGQGRYQLEVVTNGARGAIVGRHKVSVTVREDEEIINGADAPVAQQNAKRRIPVKYSRDSILSMDVPKSGTQDANFDLNSTP